jgi:hypothetical protein
MDAQPTHRAMNHLIIFFIGEYLQMIISKKAPLSGLDEYEDADERKF